MVFGGHPKSCRFSETCPKACLSSLAGRFLEPLMHGARQARDVAVPGGRRGLLRTASRGGLETPPLCGQPRTAGDAAPRVLLVSLLPCPRKAPGERCKRAQTPASPNASPEACLAARPWADCRVEERLEPVVGPRARATRRGGNASIDSNLSLTLIAGSRPRAREATGRRVFAAP